MQNKPEYTKGPIAAAPDLLAICKEIANSDCDLHDSEMRIRLYAAINKAEGK